MEPGLGLEERTARLLRRSEAILSSAARPTRPRPGHDPPTPESPPPDAWVVTPLGAEPLSRPSLPAAPSSSAPGDPLLQWRLRRRGVEAAPGVSPWGGASLGSTSRGAREGRGSQDALRREPCLESRDSPEAWRPTRSGSHDALRREPCLESRDACRPMRDESHDALRREPCLKSRDACRPTRDDSHDALRREPCLESRDACRPTRDESHDALRQRAPLEERGSQAAPRREPCLKSRDLGGRGSQHAPGAPTQAPWGRAVGQDAAVGDLLQQTPGAPGDPLLQLLRGQRRALRGRLRTVETLLATLQDPPPQIGGGQ